MNYCTKTQNLKFEISGFNLQKNLILFALVALFLLLPTGCRKDDKKELQTDDKKELQTAVLKSDLTRINEILLKNPSLVNMNIKESDWRPIHIAARYNNCKFGKLLIRFNADLLAETKTGETAHDIALCNGFRDFAELLIQNGYPENFFTFCGLGEVKQVSSLLSKNRNIINDKISGNSYPIHIAVINNPASCLDILEVLLSAGDDVNKLGEGRRTPLHYAIYVDNYNIAKYVLAKGANPNLKDVHGRTSLHYAGIINSKALFDLLLKNGADRNVVDIYKMKPSNYFSGNSRDILKPLQGSDNKP